MADELQPETKASYIRKMQVAAFLGRTLMGGTKAMQARKEEYLPKHPNEYDDSYEFRLKTTRLRNFFKRTVHQTIGKLFAKPFTVEDESSTITNVIKNIDRSGQDVQAFTRDLVKDALSGAGVSFFLVDRMRTPAADAQQEQAGLNAPYWVNIPLESLIDIQFEKDPDIVITHLRYYQTVQRPVNRFEFDNVLQIKIIEPEGWEIWEQREVVPTDKRNGAQPSSATTSKKFRWTMVDSGPNTLGKVTLVPLYLAREAPFEGEPPLGDLADMNLEHWQMRSEQRRTVQINSFPILGVFNTEADVDALVVGPESVMKITGDNADAKFLESGGAHMEAASKEIKDLEEQMRAFGAQFEVKGEAASMETASGRVIDADEAASMLHIWAMSIKDSIELGLKYTTEWLDLTEDQAGKVQMDMKFGGRLLSDAQLERLFKLRQLGDLSREGLLTMMKKSGDLPEDFDIEDDAEKIEEDEPDDLIPASTEPGQEPGSEEEDDDDDD